MAVKIYIVSLFLMVMVFIQVDLCSAIQIKIEPETFNMVDHSSVHVTCKLDEAEAAIKTIFLMKIARKGERAIVLLHQNNSLTYSSGNAEEFPSTGSIASKVMDSNLEMTIATPDPEDSGAYTCSVYYTNGFGSLREGKATSYLTVNDPELKKLNRSIQSLLNKYERGQQQIINLATQVAESKSKVEDVEAVTDTQTKAIKALTDKENGIERKMDDLKEKTEKQIKEIADKADTSVQALKDKVKMLESGGGSSVSGGGSNQDKEQVKELQKQVQKQAQTIIDLSKKLADVDASMKTFKEEIKQKTDNIGASDNKNDDIKKDLVSVKDAANKQTGEIRDLTDKSNQNTKEIQKLNALTKVMAKNIESNKKKVQGGAGNAKSPVAFHVTSGLYNMYPVKGEPLKFNEVILNKGQGYDITTGIFTAPEDGVYAFNLYLQVPCYGCKIEVTIVANTKVLSRYSGGAQKDNDQHSVSAMTYLNAGGTAKAVVTYIGKKDWSLGYFRKSAFNGFLLRS